MYSGLSILAKERMHYYAALARNNLISVIFLACSIISCVAFLQFDAVINIIGENITYVSWVGMIYLIVKLLNPTQETILKYQLIELKIIGSKALKLLLLCKFNYMTLVLLVLYLFLKENVLLLFLFLNLSVNIYVFTRCLVHSYFFDFLFGMYCCICLLVNNIYMAVFVCILELFYFINVKRINYNNLLPMYRMCYAVSQRFAGNSISHINESPSSRSEQLSGKRKNRKWCIRHFNDTKRFFNRKEWSRIQANLEKLSSILLTNLVISIGSYYMPEIYDVFAVLIEVLIVYSFIDFFISVDAKLFCYGFVDEFSIKRLFRDKASVLFCVSFILLLPLLLILNELSWSIVIFSCLITVYSLMRTFLKPLWKYHKMK